MGIIPAVIGAASSVGELALNASNSGGSSASQQAATQAASTIPGSPTTIVEGVNGATGQPMGGGAGSSVAPDVLGQVLGNPISIPPSVASSVATGAGSSGAGAAGGGGGKSTVTPSAIGGAGPTDFNTLPWFQQNAGQTAAPQPGTPASTS